MYKHLIVKAHRQHTSTVMTIPKLLCRQLKIEAGDYILLTFRTDGNCAELNRFEGKDGKDGRGKGRSDQKDRRRRTRAKVGDRR